jgi:hypothetical protein
MIKREKTKINITQEDVIKEFEENEKEQEKESKETIFKTYEKDERIGLIKKQDNTSSN